MCGIGGILRFDAEMVSPDALTEMGRSLRHRGPDGQGFWHDSGIGLVNCRLSVLGLGPQGHQPMTSADGRLVITHNGEIYNYREIRGELSAAGHRFRSDTDTEVVLAAYLALGVDGMLRKLNGMFAFALWDAEHRRLVLARDRLGIKPLYVERGPNGLAFASELDALARARRTRPELDSDSLDAFLAFGYVPEPRTIWRRVSAVEPGSVLVWEAGRETVTRYWRLRPNMAPTPRSFREATERLRVAVTTAVRRQLVSDVPLGVFLSGGVDSSIVAAVASRELPGIAAITVRFGESDFDESVAAAETAARLGMPHHVELVTADQWPELLALASAYGQPFADSSALAVSAISRVARGRMTVALAGDGGDELFGGYPTYRASEMAETYGRLPSAIHATLDRIARALPVSHAKVGIDERARRFTAAARYGQPSAHLRWREYAGPDVRDRLLGRPSSRPESLLEGPLGQAAAFSGGDRYLAIDTLSYLPSDMLHKVDIASMRHGLEVRVPLLDQDVVELAFAIPHGMKHGVFGTKRVLRAAFAGVVPAGVLGRRKQGFSVPLARWLAGPLYALARDMLSDRAARGATLIDSRYAVSLLDEHRARRADHAHALWAVLALYSWYGAIDTAGGVKGSGAPLGSGG